MAGGLAIVLVAVCTTLNLAPSIYSWSLHGRPMILRDKLPAESEVYGLKIRQLVSPVFNNSLPPLRRWAEREGAAQFPLETENTKSRLGVVGTLGFLILMSFWFLPGVAQRFHSSRLLLGASRLTLAAILLGTIGGFGSLFSLLITPEIRAWSRLCPFIAFFSLTAIAVAMDSLVSTRRRRIVSAAIVLVLGLADQRMAATDLNAAYPIIAAELPSLQSFVRRIGKRAPRPGHGFSIAVQNISERRWYRSHAAV